MLKHNLSLIYRVQNLPTLSIIISNNNNIANSTQNTPHRGDRLYTSESDVCRRQILTYKDDPRTERMKIFIIAVDP